MGTNASLDGGGGGVGGDWGVGDAFYSLEAVLMTERREQCLAMPWQADTALLPVLQALKVTVPLNPVAKSGSFQILKKK